MLDSYLPRLFYYEHSIRQLYLLPDRSVAREYTLHFRLEEISAHDKIRHRMRFPIYRVQLSEMFNFSP